MKKSDLKGGMRVFTKEGNEYLVIRGYDGKLVSYGEDILCNMNRDSFMPLSDYNENLEYDKDKFAICKVLSPKSPSVILSRNLNDFKVIWELEEIIKLTQFEYDLLKTNDQSHQRSIGSYKTYVNMKNAGYYNGIKCWDMPIESILNHCEVVE